MTVSAAETTEQELAATSEQIDQVMTAFETIADTIGDAATGIDEIATANDQQAQNVEEVVHLTEDALEGAETVRSESADVDAVADELHDIATQLREQVEALSDDQE